MDFDLTQDQREIQALAREFAQAEIDPHDGAYRDAEADEMDRLRERKRELALTQVLTERGFVDPVDEGGQQHGSLHRAYGSLLASTNTRPSGK